MWGQPVLNDEDNRALWTGRVSSKYNEAMAACFGIFHRASGADFAVARELFDAPSSDGVRRSMTVLAIKHGFSTRKIDKATRKRMTGLVTALDALATKRNRIVHAHWYSGTDSLPSFEEMQQLAEELHYAAGNLVAESYALDMTVTG